ncbi:MAG: AMP-binding protein [Acidimicrobiales bacterium]|nr:AMP-binding protein [Acidimicrobiales bacterium]
MVTPVELYHSAPYPVRAAAASARGAYLRAWRYGPGTDASVEAALVRDRWPEARWNAAVARRLAAVLGRAARDVPFYRDEGLPAGQAGDLWSWPVLAKPSVRAAPRRFVADDRDPRWMFADHTSGSSGTPLTVYETRATVRAWYALVEARLRRWYGVSRRDRWAILGGQLVVRPDTTSPPYWVWNAGLRQLYLSSYHLAPSTAVDYARALEAHGCTYLLGYPSAMAELARAVLDAGYRPAPLRVCIGNAEPLLDHQRELIGEVFDCRVRDTYGMSELTVAASECEAGRMHLWPEVGHLEVLAYDADEPVAPGETGRLVCTSLLNADMPLVRYDTGDSGSLAPRDEGCPCGRLLPMLASLEGRVDDLVVLADGRRIGRLDPVFKSDLPIVEAQIVQEALDRFRLVVVPATGFGPDTEAMLVRRLRDRVGPVQVVLQTTCAIPRGANGKFKAVVSEVATPLVEPET